MNIVITGASKGFGRALAEKFAADGKAHLIMICARDKERLEKTADELRSVYKATEFKTYDCDLGLKEDVLAFGEWILSNATEIDILINNAGIYYPGSVITEQEGTLEKLINVNLYSAYHLTRKLLPDMIQNRRGHIFNMCSIASLNAYPNGGAYSISKYALAGFSKNLREELKPFDIKVTAVYPGAAYTDSWKNSGVDPQRLMDEKDIADMVYAAANLSSRACVEEILLRPQLGDL
ncbi:MAG: SDR family NAD(P)-dependent oxidoreductase [Chitinophagaceae bacterium]|nr:MAG: SDR family NAD(P)-dependent oxidoreductase [Chitinophagaceae bacterium]